METTHITGYSSRAFDPEFREEMRKIVQKNYRKALVKTIICAAIVAASVLVIVIAYRIPEMTVALAWATVAAVAAIPVFGVLTIIRIFLTSIDASLVKDLDKEYWEGEIISRQEWEVTRTDGQNRSYKTNDHRLIIKRNDGKTFNFTGPMGRTVIHCAQDGDKVRYHPGFIYQIELFDKSNGNICVFCCKKNDAKNNTCEKCGKPMLV